MPARRPEEVHQLFAKEFSAGNLDGLMALYEPNATLLPAPGEFARGHDAIREALAGFLAANPTIDMHFETMVEADGLAQLFSSWTIRGAGRNGAPLHLTGRTADVVRRQPDGSWRIVIDNPNGGDGAQAD